MNARAIFATLAFAALSACGSSDKQAAPTPSAAPAARPAAALPPADIAPPPAATGPSAEQLAVLENRDCRAIAEAYFAAIDSGDFAFAAEFWNDPVIDGARLEALFSGYVTPRVAIADIQEEGAAGSLFCTVSGVLGDSSDPRVAPKTGEIVLRRVNDVDGATKDQLRWTIRSSTFVEPMERSAKAGPR